MFSQRATTGDKFRNSYIIGRLWFEYIIAEQEITPPTELEITLLEEETELPGPLVTSLPTQEPKTEEPLIQEDIYYTPPRCNQQ